MWLSDLFFSSFPQNWYVEVRISRNVSESRLEFEITRVDCNYIKVGNEGPDQNAQKGRMIRASVACMYNKAFYSDCARASRKIGRLRQNVFEKNDKGRGSD